MNDEPNRYVTQIVTVKHIIWCKVDKKLCQLLNESSAIWLIHQPTPSSKISNESIKEETNKHLNNKEALTWSMENEYQPDTKEYLINFNHQENSSQSIAAFLQHRGGSGFGGGRECGYQNEQLPAPGRALLAHLDQSGKIENAVKPRNMKGGGPCDSDLQCHITKN